MNKNMELKFLKIRDVKSPVRGTAEAAGIDFFVPNYNAQFVVDFREKNPNIDYAYTADDSMQFVVKPGQRVLIPSGIKTWMTPGTALIAANKSGVASKKGLIFGAQVVDSDYAGEVHISVINTSNDDVLIKCGEKLIQFIHTPVLLTPPEEVDEYMFNALHDKSQRGEGGFGSTGTK
jgi:dUTP pyrophosphatase